MYTCMPNKTNTCLLSRKPTVTAMDLDSDMAKKLSQVDLWTVVTPGDAKAMADAILKQYQSGNWDVYLQNADEFMRSLGPVENAEKYVEILLMAGKGLNRKSRCGMIHVITRYGHRYVSKREKPAIGGNSMLRILLLGFGKIAYMP